MPLSKVERDALPDNEFAVPGKRALPIVDAAHVKMAWDGVGNMRDLTAQERSDARVRITAKAADLGVDVSGWSNTAFALNAMALNIGTDEHPNKLPFSGVLTFVDRASDNPVGGTKLKGSNRGFRTYIPRAVAAEALSSLLGMAIDYTKNLDGHDAKSKIGLITEATIVGDEIRIAGFFYAADFPEEVARIQAEKDNLGFSYEAQGRIRSLDVDPWYVEHCTFTGGAVLYKDMAAYTQTSLAASADMEPEMSKEILEAIAALAKQNETLATDVAQLKAGQEKSVAAQSKAKPHANSMRALAAAMITDGIGTDAANGHAALLNRIADQLEAQASLGTLPQVCSVQMAAAASPATNIADLSAEAIKPLLEQIATLSTQVTDLKAAAFTGAQQPERKTVSPEIIQLIGKLGLSAAHEKDGVLSVEEVDKTLAAAGIRGTAAITAKLNMMSAGVLKAA